MPLIASSAIPTANAAASHERRYAMAISRLLLADLVHDAEKVPAGIEPLIKAGPTH